MRGCKGVGGGVRGGLRLPQCGSELLMFASLRRCRRRRRRRRWSRSLCCSGRASSALRTSAWSGPTARSSRACPSSSPRPTPSAWGKQNQWHTTRPCLAQEQSIENFRYDKEEPLYSCYSLINWSSNFLCYVQIRNQGYFASFQVI